jgi:hypothetical protein
MSGVIARSKATKQSMLPFGGAMHCFPSLAMTDANCSPSGMVRGTRPQMRKYASGILEIPGLVLRTIPE